MESSLAFNLRRTLPHDAYVLDDGACKKGEAQRQNQSLFTPG
jgi:hypothetical protein